MRKYCLLLLSLFVFTFLKAEYVIPEAGKVFRIVNPYYSGIVLTEDFGANTLSCNAKGGDDSYTQLWKFTRNGTAWYLQNIYTGRYIVPQGSYYNQYRTASTPSNLFISSNPAATRLYNILNTSGGNLGLHCDGSRNVVPWTKGSGSISATEWHFELVDISEEDIEKARAQYQAYLDLLSNRDEISAKYMSFFSDAACTELASNYAIMSDDELHDVMSGCSPQLISLATKIKNDVWSTYEKDFRIANYGPHSNLDYWAGVLNTNQHCPLSNPTGIYGNSGDVLYIFVGGDIPQGATLQVDRVNGNSAFGTRETLAKGMNIVPVGRDQSMLFIAYTVDTSGDKFIADYDSLKIHIQGGVLNGFFDKRRHTDADWAYIANTLATHEMIQVKGERALLHMDRGYITAANCCPNTITDAIDLWDDITKAQHETMGFDDYFPAKFNNHVGARSTADGFMSAGAHFTNYQYATLTSILPRRNVTDVWGPAHEIGHVYQHAINMMGCAEVSNNLFSNICTYNFGRCMSRGETIANKVAEYEAETPFLIQSIWQCTRMYWQLYLYYHIAGNNPNFYPTLFELLRKDPLRRQEWVANSAEHDQLKFAEKCAEAAGEDLTAFFEAAGFFVPMNNLTVADYSTFYITSTPEMINATKAKLAAYPKKAAAIEFIEDRVDYSPRTDGVSGNRLVYGDSYGVGQAGDLGQYTAFTPDSMKTTASGYLYNKMGKTIYFTNGTGAVGFRIYNTEGKLLTYCNTLQHQLSDKIFSQELVVKAVSANGEESEVRTVFEGDEATQKEALKTAIDEATKLLRLEDTSGTRVGYYYGYAVETLSSLNKLASAAYAAADQDTHTYGEWAKMLSDELNRLFSDSSVRVGINEKNYYTLRNVQYTSYRIAYSASAGTLGCTSNTTTNDFMRFTFIPTGTEGEYYMRHINGAYVSSVAQSTRVEANATTVSGAVKFNLIDNLNGQFCVQKVGDGMGYLHCDRYYAVVGWNNSPTGSYWNITCVNDNQAAEDLLALDALIEQANATLDEIIDEEKSTATTTLYDYVEVLDNEIFNYITALQEELEVVATIKQGRYTNLYAQAAEALSARIQTLQAAYALPTSISDLEVDTQPLRIFTIGGKQVESMGAERIYIVNGKKVLNKR